MFAPESRLRAVNAAPLRGDGDYVLYWMIGGRRTRYHFGLQHALARCAALGKPLLVLEALGLQDRWAAVRFHHFVLGGMRDQRAAFGAAGVTYYPYVERQRGEGDGLLAALAERAALVVTDDTPVYHLPKLVARAGARLSVRLEAVDSCGLIPVRAPGRAFPVAHMFRRWVQREGRQHLEVQPVPEPLLMAGAEAGRGAVVPAEVLARWPAAHDLLDGGALSALAVDHSVPAVRDVFGGEAEGQRRLLTFVRSGIERYAERNDPDAHASSGLSPWLHFGHVSTAELFAELGRESGWAIEDAAPVATGRREGWWGLPPTVESFLDELVVWRELGYVEATFNENFDRYEGLPDWARRTLDEHRADARRVVSLAALDGARSPERLWNAAQRELRETGRIHNYMRMLWGKLVLAWTATPEDCFEVLEQLNNKWSLDGRDPSSYTGIAWVLGRHDRAWGPERPIYGKVRYMTAAQAQKKLNLAEWLAKYGGDR